MGIVHVVTGLGRGGAERTLYNLLSNPQARKFDHVVISLRDSGIYGDLIRSLGITVYALEMSSYWFSVNTLFKLARLLKQLKPNIIQGWMYHGNLAASLASTLVGLSVPVVWNIRHSLYSLSNEKLLSGCVIRASSFLSFHPKIVIYNSEVSIRLHQSFGFDSHKTVLIHNGFNLSLLRRSNAIRCKMRERIMPAGCDFVIGHVARFHPMKNHLGLLRVAVRIVSEYQNVCFILVGNDVTLKNPDLEHLVPSHLLDRFVFMGDRADVYDLMQSMDCLCLSSSWGEAFPNVIGEAMALEVPCVVTDVGDSAAIVANTGIVVPPANEDALFSGLEAMVLKSEDERLELGRLARNRIAERFSIEESVGQYVDIYTELNG